MQMKQRVPLASKWLARMLHWQGLDYHTMWNFAHAEGLSFKKNRAGQ